MNLRDNLITNYYTFKDKLDEVQSCSHNKLKRTVTLENIKEILREAEHKLEHYLPKKEWKGVVLKLNYHFWPKPARENKLNSTCTIIEVVRLTQGWKIIKAYRETVNAKRVIFLNADMYSQKIAEYLKKQSLI